MSNAAGWGSWQMGGTSVTFTGYSVWLVYVAYTLPRVDGPHLCLEPVPVVKYPLGYHQTPTPPIAPPSSPRYYKEPRGLNSPAFPRLRV
eukprot:759256-Hanusia_phi.AAC.1